MMDAQDTTRMAQQFLELWQREFTRQMSNPDTLTAMLQAMQAFSMNAKEPPHDASRRTAPASDAQHDAIRELTLRVSTLERELAKLRRQFSQSVPAKKPARKKRRSRAAVVVKTKRAAKSNRKRMAKRVGRLKRKPKRNPKS